MGDEPEYLIMIDYDDFLTIHDLNHIIYLVDTIIDDRQPPEPFYPELMIDRWFNRNNQQSYVGITGVSSGSVILTVIISYVVSNYISSYFNRGFRSGGLSDEIKRTGKLSSDALGLALGRINNYFANFIPEQKKLGGKIKSVKIEKVIKESKNANYQTEH